MRLFSIHLGYVLGSLPFPERFVRARELGFRAVEIPFPYVMSADEYAHHLKHSGLRQISIGARTSDYRKGEVGLAVSPRLRDDFVHSLREAAVYAERIACPAVHVFSGCADPELPAGVTEDVYCENIAMAAKFLAARGIATLIEPINTIDFPGYYLNSLHKALGLIARIGSPDVRLIFDVYHMRTMGEDPAAALGSVHSQVEHIQFADHPGRHEPGTGSLDLAGIVNTLRNVGYRGSAGLEYIPTRPPNEPLNLPPALADYAGLSAGR